MLAGGDRALLRCASGTFAAEPLTAASGGDCPTEALISIATTARIDALTMQRLTPRAAMPALVAVAIALRLCWWAVGPKVVEDEGSYYARVGENLAAGRGYLGMREQGLQLLYPPMFPGLIAAGVAVGMPAEEAGRAVSFLAGSLLPLVVFFIARRLYGYRSALWATSLVAVHPLLIVLSTAVLTEALYLTLALAGVLLTQRTLAGERRGDAAGAGAMFGLAYLTRPEGIFLGALAAIIVLIAGARRRRPAIARAGLMAATIALVAAPYIVFLSREAGCFRIEGKTPEGIAFAERRAAGENIADIYAGVDRNLVEHGLSNVSNQEVIATTRATTLERARLLLSQARMNLPQLLTAVTGLYAGAIFLDALVALGWFSIAWSRLRLLLELPLLAMAALTLCTFAGWPFFHERFIFPLLAPMVVWAGRGLETLHDWAGGTAAALGTSSRTASAASLCGALAAVAAVVGASVVGTRSVDEVSDSWSPRVTDRRIGEDLRARGAAHTRLADVAPTIAYYADAVLVVCPATDEQTAARYLRKKNVDWLVLRDASVRARGYFRDWVENGPPASDFQPYGTFADGNGGLIHVYRHRGSVQ